MRKTTLTLIVLPLAVSIGFLIGRDASDRTEPRRVTTVERVDGYISLDAAAEPLRTRFNDDIGKTRVLMLVAPT